VGSSDNRTRKKWQDYSGENAGKAETDFYTVFNEYFDGTDYRIRKKPKDFQKIYVEVKLSNETLEEIFTPSEPIKTHGITPDYAIDNLKTKKTLYVEVKRQDGWVEGKSRSAGRGNAHERSNKFFTPGLLDKLRETGGIFGEGTLPF